MSYNSGIHHRRSVRLKGYDYTQDGAYYITICTHDRVPMFGDIVDGTMQLNEFGLLVESEWAKTAEIRGNVSLDEYVLMPNHFHGILVVADDCRGTARRAPTERFGKPTPDSVPTIVRAFKSAVTKRINEIHETTGTPVWQRNYYEHVIRNEKELNAIRKYIVENPLEWDLDSENPFARPEGNPNSRKQIADAAQFDLVSHNPEQTQKVGFVIGELAQAGDLVLLVGELGAGKTCLTQGIAHGLGLTDHTSSPSFVLVKEYSGRLYLYHIDLYRLDNIVEVEELGLDEYLCGNGICVIEWADKALNSLPEEHLLIRIEYMAENDRQLHFEAKGQRYIDLLAQLKERWNSQ